MSLSSQWEALHRLSDKKAALLEDAMRQAQDLHASVNVLLEWLSDAEMKLRFSGTLPEEEDEIITQINAHEDFVIELNSKEKDKDYTLQLCHNIMAECHPDAISVIKYSITIIDTRWEEVNSWALQRSEKLEGHLKQLRAQLRLLDDLKDWLSGKERELTEAEREHLPEDMEIVKKLIDEHHRRIDGLSSRQADINSVCKPVPLSSMSRKTSRGHLPR